MRLLRKILITLLLVINIATFFLSLELSLVAVMFTSVVLFSTELVRPFYTGWIIIFLIFVHVPAGYQSIIEGFQSPVLLFMLAVVGIGTAFAHSNLGRWFIYAMTKIAEKWTLPLPIILCLSFVLLPLFLPSSITRNYMLFPLMQKFLGPHNYSFTAKRVYLTLGVLNVLASSAILTGGISAIITTSFISGFTWGKWFLFMGLPYYLFLFSGVLYILLRYPVKDEGENDEYERTIEDLKKPTFQREDTKLLFILILMVGIWLSESWHGFHPAIGALIGVICIYLFTRALGWRDIKESSVWRNILILGSLMSLITALGHYGIITIMTQYISYIFAFGSSPILLLLMVIGCTILFNLIIPNGSVCLTFLLPIFITLSGQIGLEPIIVALTITMVIDGIKFYPSQSIPLLIVYDRRVFSPTDVSQLGVAMTFIFVILLMTIILPYWTFLGL